MQVSVEKIAAYTFVRLSGDVDLQHSPTAREQILKQINANDKVMVDLSAVSYIDSSGIASLVEGLQLAKKQNHEFGLIGVSKPVFQVLQLARLDTVFTIYDSPEQLPGNSP